MTPADLPDDATLLGSIALPWSAAGREAMSTLFDLHAAPVRAYLLRLAPGREAVADDCVQDAFVTVFEHAQRFEGGSARPWLLAIATRRLADRRRSETRRRERESRHAAERSRDAEPTAADPTSADPELESQLAALPARDRAVLELRFVQGLTHAQVAETLGVSLRTAKTWSEAALDRVRSALDSEVAS